MPGLLRDPSEDPPPTDKGGSLTSPEDLRAKASSEIGECVEVQEWLAERYRFLRRELEDVDREITRLRRRMERQAQRREEYIKELNNSL